MGDQEVTHIVLEQEVILFNPSRVLWTQVSYYWLNLMDHTTHIMNFESWSFPKLSLFLMEI